MGAASTIRVVAGVTKTAEVVHSAYSVSKTAGVDLQKNKYIDGYIYI